MTIPSSRSRPPSRPSRRCVPVLPVLPVLPVPAAPPAMPPSAPCSDWASTCSFAVNSLNGRTVVGAVIVCGWLRFAYSRVSAIWAE